MDERKMTHTNSRGEAQMVDVGLKAESERLARAEGMIWMAPETLAQIIDGTTPKGDVLACARIACIMASKRTAELIPLCHPLSISKCELDLSPVFDGPGGKVGIHVEATLGVFAKTGIEMEALCAVSIACLTVYDMCKAIDRGMEIDGIRLLYKAGGRSGTWERGIDAKGGPDGGIFGEEQAAEGGLGA